MCCCAGRLWRAAAGLRHRLLRGCVDACLLPAGGPSAVPSAVPAHLLLCLPPSNHPLRRHSTDKTPSICSSTQELQERVDEQQQKLQQEKLFNSPVRREEKEGASPHSCARLPGLPGLTASCPAGAACCPPDWRSAPLPAPQDGEGKAGGKRKGGKWPGKRAASGRAAKRGKTAPKSRQVVGAARVADLSKVGAGTRAGAGGAAAGGHGPAAAVQAAAERPLLPSSPLPLQAQKESDILAGCAVTLLNTTGYK